MNAKQILDDLNKGDVVTIRASDAFQFMRECERHSLQHAAIKMVFVEGRCVMRDAEAFQTTRNAPVKTQ